MIRSAIFAGTLAWCGLTLLLGQSRWVRRARLAERLRPFAPWSGSTSVPAPRNIGRSFGVVVGPLAQSIGARSGQLFGITEDLSARLARTHSSLDVSTFRTRQLGWALASVVAGAGVLAVLRPPALAGLLVVPAAVIGAYAITEQQLKATCAHWDRRRMLELPVITEQIAMLVAAGFSVGTALSRVADRGHGACAMDLARVCARIRQGVGERQALTEWATTTRSAAVARVATVLVLASDTTDVARLLSEEARALRRDVQRQNVTTMDRRAEQVWVPVTVAALIPGVLLLAVPFVDALRLFGAG
jgi:tight adherence protein C